MATAQKRSKVEDGSREASPEEENPVGRTSPENAIGGEAKDASNPVGDTMKSVPQICYSRSQLFEIAKAPLAKQRPPCLDLAYDNGFGLWDPEKWFLGKRRAESPLTDDVKCKREKPPDLDRDSFVKRRMSDPKERIKDEQDNIVLSPQRRSFGTGCHVTVQPSSRRPESPCDLRSSERSSFFDRDPHREPNRRIGSGRIISRDRDNRQEREFGFRSSDRRDRYEKEERDLRFGSRGNREYSDRRNRRQQRIEEEEEPEWFSGGPTSQLETIELHGFEDALERDDDDFEPKGSRRWRRGSWRKTKPVVEENGIPEEDEKEEETMIERSKRQARQSSENMVQEMKTYTATEDAASKSSSTPEFDVNKLFEMDSLSAFLPQNGTPPDSSRGSRFSQWFRTESPIVGENGIGGRRSSQPDEPVGNFLRGADMESSVAVSTAQTSGDAFFEPISPAQADGSKNILELLQKAPHEAYGKSESSNSALQELVVSGQAHQVQEIEAELKQLVLGAHLAENNAPNGQTVPKCQSNEEDLTAFKKLLAQISEGQAQPVQQGSASFGHLDKSKALQEKDIVQMSRVKDDVGRQSLENFMAKNVNHMKILKDAPTEQDILAGNIKGHCLQQSPPSSSGATYPDFLLRVLQQQQQQQHQQQQHHHHHQHQQQQHQQQSSMPIRRQSPNSHDDALAKLLSNSSNLRPSSPTIQELLSVQMKRQASEVPAYQQAGMVNSQINQTQAGPAQTVPNKLLQQRQHQREILASIVKQQQQQQQQLQQAAATAVQLQPPILTQPPAQSPPAPLLNRVLSPRPQSPHSTDTMHQSLFQTSQPRIPSPLIFGQTPPLLSHAPSPIHPGQVGPPMGSMGATLNPNNLQVYNNQLMHRVPSPQELVLHTQQIMQNALIKSKLEEQKENYRKRQELQRTRSPNIQSVKIGTEGSPSKVSNLSTTMAAFTPTSVMRKMQAEKEKDPLKLDVGSQSSFTNKTNDGKFSIHPAQLKSSVVGGPSVVEGDKVPRPLHGQGLMHSHVPVRGSSGLPSGQMGRPIVKGNQGLAGTSLVPNKSSAITNQKLGIPAVTMNLTSGKPSSNTINGSFDMNKLLEQQRHLQNVQRQLNASPMPSSSMAHSNFPGRGGSGGIHPNMGRSAMNMQQTNVLLRNMVHPNVNQAAIRAHLNQIALLQQHALDPRMNMTHQAAALQHLLLGASANPRSQHPNVNLQGPLVGMAATKQQDVQQFSSMQGSCNLNNNLASGNGASNMAANRHSPINNLSKWFNSEMLKQKLPDLPPVPKQKALSLEEVERRQQQQTAVHI